MERKALGLLIFTIKEPKMVIIYTGKITQINGIAKRSGHDEKS